MEFTISCEKSTCELTTVLLDTIWTGIGLVFTPFLISTNRLLILTDVMPNVPVFACSNPCSISAELNEMSEHRNVP